MDLPVWNQDSWLVAKDWLPGPNQEPESGNMQTAHTESRPRYTGVSQMGPESRLEQAQGRAGKEGCFSHIPLRILLAVI